MKTKNSANWGVPLPKSLTISLALFSALFMCLVMNSAMAQETSVPKSNSEPVDPAREKLKEAYFKKMKEEQPSFEKKTQVSSSAEPLPIWKDTGDFESDRTEYLTAVKGWLERNGSLYSEEELEFLKKPITSVSERQQSLLNN